jgi:hypothetical protein
MWLADREADMNRQVLGILAGVILIMAVGRVPSYAQTATTKIPYEFHAGGAVLSAGTYSISYSDARPWILILRGPDGSNRDLRVVTRLAQKSPPNLECYLVFDKEGDTYFLSELWFPAMDGFLLGGEPMRHTHVTVKATMQQGGLP